MQTRAATGSAIALVLGCLVALTSAAPPKEQYQHPLTNLPPRGEISTSHFFPDAPNKHFTAGEPVKVVLGIHNDGAEAYNISAIMGSLNSPMDFKMYIQNFTQQIYFNMLEPGAEMSVEYSFTPAKELSPRDFIVALTLFYQQGANGTFLSTTFFNSTVEIIEMKKLIDTELLFLYVLLLAIAGVAGYFLYQQVQGAGLLKGLTQKKKKPEVVRTAADDDEWVKDTAYDLFKKRKAATAANKAKKAS